MLKNILHILHRAVHHNSGNVSIILAMTVGIVSLMTYSTIDYNRVTNYKTITQSALDAAIIAGVLEATGGNARADLAAVTTKAQSVFNANTANISDVVTFKNFTVSGNGGAYTANVNFAVNRIFSKGLANEVKFDGNNNLSATASYISKNAEIAIAIDTSSAMVGKIDEAKNIVNTIVDYVFMGQSSLSGVYFSILPYNDAIKIEPVTTSNRWLKNSYSNASDFGGCMIYRDVVGAIGMGTNGPPTDGDVTKFYRYEGPFYWRVRDVVDTYGFDASGNRHNTNFTSRWVNDEIAISGGIVFSSGFNRGRYDFEIDYVYDIDGITGTEKLIIDLGAEYPGGSFRIPIWNFPQTIAYSPQRDTINELGRWEAYDGAGTLAGSSDFSGDLSIPYSNPVTPNRELNISGMNLQRLELSARDNGNRTQKNCPGIYSLGGTQTSACVYENSDYQIQSIFYTPDCTNTPAEFFMNARSNIKSSADAVTLSGVSMTPIGLEWAWSSLSPNWTGVLPGSEGRLPRAIAADNKKIAIIIAGSGETDSDLMKQIDRNCRGMKVDDKIEVYAISLDAPNQIRNALRKCATDNKHFFINPSKAEIKSIALKLRGAAQLLKLTN